MADLRATLLIELDGRKRGVQLVRGRVESLLLRSRPAELPHLGDWDATDTLRPMAQPRHTLYHVLPVERVGILDGCSLYVD